MSPPSPIVLAVSEGLAASVCLWRVCLLDLSRRYPALVCFLLFQIGVSITAFIAGIGSGSYLVVYVGLVVLEWLVYAAMVKEIYGSMFAGFPGIAFLGRHSVYGALATTAIVCVLSMMALSPVWSQRVLLNALEFISHCLSFGFAAVVLIMLWGISRYPLQLRKNVVINSVLFGILLLGEAGALIAEELTAHRYPGLINVALGVELVVCLALWTILLSRERQPKVPKDGYNVSGVDEEALLGQLRAINTLLGRLMGMRATQNGERGKSARRK